MCEKKTSSNIVISTIVTHEDNYKSNVNEENKILEEKKKYVVKKVYC